MFVKKFDGGDFLILLLYVDDILIVGRDLKKIGSLKKALSKSFARSDEEAIVAVTREVRDKGAPKVQHGGCETGLVDTIE